MKKLLLATLFCLCPLSVALSQTDPNGTNYSWSLCTPTLNAGVSVASGVVTRTASSSGYQQAYAQCNETIPYGTGAIAVKINSPTDVMRVGLTNTGTWNLTPSQILAPGGTNIDPSYSGPTFGFSLSGNGSIRMWEQQNRNPNATNRVFEVFIQNGVVQANDWIIVYMDEGRTRYIRERAGVQTVLYTSDTSNPVYAVYPLFPQISISTNGAQATVKVLRSTAFGTAGTVYVSATGTFYGAGTQADPTTMERACSTQRPVGGTSGNNIVDIGAGTYAPIVCYNGGTVGTPLVFQSHNYGTWPLDTKIVATNRTINLEILADYTTWRDIEFYNSDVSDGRISTDPAGGASESDLHRTDTVVTNGGSHTTFINIVVHDGKAGVVSQTRGGFTCYGCISYNNGYSSIYTGVGGSGTYVHNEPQNDRSLEQNCVFFNNGRQSVHYYNQQAGTPTGKMDFDKIISINAGINIEGQGSKNDITVTNSHVFGNSIKFGYADEVNQSGTVTGNYVYGQQPLDTKIWAGITVANNKFVGQATNQGVMQKFSQKTGQALTSYVFSNNIYYRNRTGQFSSSPQFAIFNQAGAQIQIYTFAQWQAASATFDPDSTYYNTANEEGTPFSQSVAVRPNTTDVYVYPNIYQTGRGHVVIWNWPLANNVSANFSTLGLVNGQKYDVISIQSGKYLITQGTYSASSPTVSIPMNTDDAPISWIGNAGLTPATTMPGFGVFLVIPGAQSNVNAPIAPSSLAISRCTLVLGCTLTWTSNSNSGPDADTGFIIDRSDNGGAFVNVTTTAAHAVSYTNVPGAYGTYVYRIRSTNAAGDSINQIFGQEANPSVRCYGIPAACVR